MSDKYNLITPENIQAELIRNEIEQNDLQVQVFKEQKYNEMLRDYKQLQHNWNELKKYVQEELKDAEDDFAQEDFIKVLDRMQELENSNNDI